MTSASASPSRMGRASTRHSTKASRAPCTSPRTPRCATWPSIPKRNRFELLSPGLRVELADDGLLGQVVAAAGGTGGKAYPRLGFAIVHLSPQANPVDAAHAIEAMPGVIDVRLMTEGPRRVPR